MRTITIRGIDDILAKMIKDAANRDSVSVNQYLLSLLKKNFGQIKEKTFTKKHHDLDELFGSWNDDEYGVITKQLEEHRQIDWELWK